MNAYGRLEVHFQAFLTTAIGGGAYLTPWFGRFTSDEKALYKNIIGNYVAPRTYLDTVEERKIYARARNPNLKASLQSSKP
jgi:hypothetical protein